ncbi:GNAT family N-acetyltransferase [Kitasatospora sp. NPDC094015]|uniref:GNAT family N-acetyltransferase n=1 Tax=Kitasatospora sp. NPDC094015 TaxID=3155205 RepID=UPI00332DF594
MTTPTPGASPAPDRSATGGAPVLRRPAADEWTRYRDVRLAALAQAPEAFGSTHAREAAFTEERWRERLTARNTVIAELDGAPCGLAGLVGAGDGRAELVSMWVHPRARGRGVGDLLVRAVIERAEELGRPEVRLWVAEGNAPAERLYDRHGFARTGEEQPVDDEQPCRGLEFAMTRPAGS